MLAQSNLGLIVTEVTANYSGILISNPFYLLEHCPNGS
jgi:hypothetical protein